MQVKALVKVNIKGTQAIRQAFERAKTGIGVAAIDAMFTQWARRYEGWTKRRFMSASAGDGTWPALANSTLYKRARASISRVYEAFRHGEITAAQRDQKLKRARAVFRRGWMNVDPVSFTRQLNRRAAALYNRYALSKGSPRAITGPQLSAGLAKLQKQHQRVGKVQEKLGGRPGAMILQDTGVLRGGLSLDATGNINERDGLSQVYGIGGPATHGKDPITIGTIASYHQHGGSLPGRPPKREILVKPKAGDPFYQQLTTDLNLAMRRLLRGGA